jgi:hypothetical protein
MKNKTIDALILYRSDLTEKASLKLNYYITLSDFYLSKLSIAEKIQMEKKELIVFSAGNFRKILISRHF